MSVGLVLVLGACKPLREYPAAQRMVLGTAARASVLATDGVYRATLAKEFNALVPENELKWATIHPAGDAYNFGPADSLVSFAQQNGMVVRGVPLLWRNQNPSWITTGHFTAAQMRYIVAAHIATVVGRYKGRIAQWDVVNEPFGSDGLLQASIWRNYLGPRYMDFAFQQAHAADPSAKLFLNEFDIDSGGPKADAVFAEVSAMKQRGVPIDGVGLQMHVDTTSPTQAQLQAQTARYASIGIEVAITEMDVRLQIPATAANLQTQAKMFVDAFATCREATNCNTFMMWGFTDKYSWVPSWQPGLGSATIMDETFGKKPAYDALNDYLARG